MFGATEFDPTKERGGPPIDEQVEALAGLVKAGKIRHYGLSNETAWGVCEFRRVAREQGVPGPVTIQNSYSLVSRGVDNDLAETLFREQMSLLAYSPLGGGVLTGKYLGGAAAAGLALCAVRRISACGFSKPIVHEAVAAYAALAKQAGLSLVELALGYVKSRWHLGATIIGATSLAQLEREHRGRAVRARRVDARGDRRVQMRYPNPAG